MHKYPRTMHMEGSRIQPGDRPDRVPLSDLRGRHLVVEEKVDGANVGVSFESGRMMLQSRGHYLTGGDYSHFDPFKRWAYGREHALREVLADRYVMYGEWLYAKHTIFYDALPDYFVEFDVLDKGTGKYLDTPGRKALLAGLGICSAPVLYSGGADLEALEGMVGASSFSTEGILMEGLYVKVEENGEVAMRCKWVRPSFVQASAEAGTYWLRRPLIPNRLAPDKERGTHGRRETAERICRQPAPLDVSRGEHRDG